MRVGVAGVLAVGAAVAVTGYLSSAAQKRGQDALAAQSPISALGYARDAQRWAPWSPYPRTLEGEALLATGDVASAAQAFRSALQADPGYWRAWLGLAVASRGAARQAALERARTLYPRSREIDETEESLDGL